MFLLTVSPYATRAQTSLVIPRNHTIDLAKIKKVEIDKKKFDKVEKKLKKAERKLIKRAKKEQLRYETMAEQELGKLSIDSSAVKRWVNSYDYTETIPEVTTYKEFAKRLELPPVEEFVDVEELPYWEEYAWTMKHHHQLKEIIADTATLYEYRNDSMLIKKANAQLAKQEQRLLERSGIGDIEDKMSTSYDDLYADLYPVDLQPKNGFDAFEAPDLDFYLQEIRGLPAVEEQVDKVPIDDDLLDSSIKSFEKDKKISGFKEVINELVDQHTDEIKEQSFLERSGLSGYLSFSRADPLGIDIAPNYFYHATGRLDLGVGFNYRILFGEEDSLAINATSNHPVMAYRVYAQYKIVLGLYTHLEYEHNVYPTAEDFESTDFPINSDEHYIGIGRDVTFRGNTDSSFLILYNLTQTANSPNHSRFQFRFGFKFN